MAKSIGRYEIRDELGRGGMAVVYRAFDPKLHRDVALKLMDQQLSADPAFAARFEREARTVAALEHTAIVSLYDYGEVEGWLYLVMPFMRGGSLKEQIAKGPLTPRQAYGVLRRIASALDKAHSKNIIHRDLKPGNILLDEEQEAYLSDFGIVKVAKGDTEYLTQTGQTIGTFAYMSPEQLMGELMDGRSDLYALGIVLFEMLTGKHPYGDESTTDAAMAVAHTQAPIPDVTMDNPALPPVFTEIIDKALAKDSGDRYATGRELAMAMYTALTGSKPAARTATLGAVGSVAATPATQKPSPPAPKTASPTHEPVVQSQNQQPAAPAAQVQPEPAATNKVDHGGDVAQNPVKVTPQATMSQAEALQALPEKAPAVASPLPRWITVLVGLVTIIAGALFIVDPSFLIGADSIAFYWIIIGLPIGVSILSRPADWRWKLAVGILGISSLIIAFAAGDGDPAGFVGIIIGLILIVQAFRGAGMALAALGTASVILGWLAALGNLPEVAGFIVILCGIVAIVLAFRQGRAAS